MTSSKKPDKFELEAVRCTALATGTQNAFLAAKLRRIAKEFAKRSRQRNRVSVPQQSWVRSRLGGSLHRAGG